MKCRGAIVLVGVVAACNSPESGSHTIRTSALAQTSVTLQQGLNGYGGTIDNKIMGGSTADTNFGADWYQTFTVETSNSGLVRFAIFAGEGGPVPDGATITSATLSLYKYWGPDAMFKASRMLKSWTELQSTWNVTGTGASWTIPGARGADDVSAIADGQGSAPANDGCDTYSGPWPASCWLTIDVTSGVQAFAGGAPNHGWKFAYVSGSNDSAAKEFYTSTANYSTGVTGLRPKLTITYTDDGTGGGTGGGACIPSPLPASGLAVATFHSMGLYYNPGIAPSGDKIFMRYRKGTDDPSVAASWKPGHDLWYDTRSVHTYHGRGSAVHLEPGTAYVFEVSRDNVTWDNYISGPLGEPCPSTWSETFPVGTTLTPFTGTKTALTSSSYKGSRSSQTRQHVLLADQSGTASGYTLYDFTGATAVAQAANAAAVYPVVISGHHIILRGLKTVGGESSIFIDPGSQDIVIEDMEMTGYGRDSGNSMASAGLTGNRAIDEDAAVKFPDASFGPILDTKRIIIQRSTMHNPAFGSCPWDIAHPAGTAALLMYPTGGQIVVRYNSVYSTTNGLLDGPPNLSKFHSDGLIQGGCNDNSGSCASQGMGIGPDVDIYKNLVMDYYDDGVETDGDATNVRVWKNYFDYGGASGISVTPTYVGPLYAWRNVYNRQRSLITRQWGNNDDRNGMFKAGGIAPYNGGRRYLYHNTAMQPPASSESSATGPNPLGAGGGATRTEEPIQNIVARNNVFELWKTNWETYALTDGSANDLDYDLSNGVISEPHVAHITPQYQAGNGWSSYWMGKYRLAPGTAGYNDGVVIPNFNDGFVGSAPDRGAHEDGTPDMDFGTSASGH